MLDYGVRYNERQFILRLKKGERNAFDELFRAQFSGLYRFANAIVCNPFRAKDIVQEIFANLWDRRNRLDESGSLTNYLYVAVRNRSYTVVSREQRYMSLDKLSTASVYPETYVCEENIQKNVLWEAIEGLPLQQKIILKLIVVEDYSYKEVALRLDISVNTVKTQIRRASEKLKKCLPPLEFFLFVLYFRKRNRIRNK